MEGRLTNNGTSVSREKMLVALSVLQALAIVALAMRKPYLSWVVLMLPVIACFVAFQIEAQRLTQVSGDRRFLDWLGRLSIGALVSNLLGSVWFLAR
jgi:hypothetical protein